MKRQILQKLFYFFSIPLFTTSVCSGYLPAPTKIVILVFENHSYNQIVGSPYAPYINSLINDSMTALFTQSYGTSHPSQPNYIQLFSGTNQGVIDNNVPINLPFTAPNLYSELTAASKTFIAYSQSLPSVGFTGATSGGYARKHAPWVNWQDTAAGAFPAILHQPFTLFPVNFNNLPDVSFVIPDQNNDMHNGTDPARIIAGDTWFQNNLNAYVQWARTNNSLLIVTFDEDDNISGNHILTFFTGPMVHHGSHSNYINHYSLLRTIEDIYGTTHAGLAASATPIDYCWKCSQPLTISAHGITSFCEPATVTLSASAGNSYLWSNGATTQNVIIDTTGNYYCIITASTGCLSTSNTIQVTVDKFPVITSIPDSGYIGGQITIEGGSFNGSFLLQLNSVTTPFTLVNDSIITFTIPVGATSGYVQITNGCGTTQSINQFIVGPPPIQFSLRVFIEGYYKGNGTMYPVLTSLYTDTINLELHHITSPYALAYSATALVDTLGNSNFTLHGSALGKAWFVVVSGKNSLPTWSTEGILFSSNTTYNFTGSVNKAYGNNQKNLSGGYFGIFSGDVNRNGIINLSDIAQMKSAIESYPAGYNLNDLTGDGMIESIDWSLLENNLGIEVIRP